METGLPHKISFISESVATIDFGNLVNEEINKKAIDLFSHLSRFPLEGMIDAIPAYSSVTIYFDIALLRKKVSPRKKIYEWIYEELHKLMLNEFKNVQTDKNLVRIPVCYEDEYAIDLPWIAEKRNIVPGEIIRLHTSKQYRVYMLGFLPGFAYMGEVEEQIAVPRKPQPQAISAGSVGITGRQTGIYPLHSPGGWQIVGRTPLKMFDKDKDELCLLKAGDYVEFYPITKNEFENY
jgi:inhibitor of KinA